MKFNRRQLFRTATGALAYASSASLLKTARLHAETARLVAADDMKKLLADAGAEPAALSTAEFGAQFRAEIAKWTKLVKQRGIRAE